MENTTKLHRYHLWYRTYFGTGRETFLCRDREHAIGVGKSLAERRRIGEFVINEDDAFGEPFFVKVEA